MILIAVVVVCLLAFVLLLALAYCWNEPVRRCGLIDLSGRKPRP